MRTTIFLVYACVIRMSCPAQSLQLVKHAFLGTERFNFSRSIATGPNSGYFVCGAFEDSIVIGSDTLIGQYTTSVYIALLDANLSPVWARKVVDNQNTTFLRDVYADMTTDTNGNLLVGLNYRDYLYLFGDTIGADDYDGVALLKLDASGELIWSDHFPGTWIGYRGVAANAAGEVFLVGTVGGDMFVRKYSSTGGLLWSQSGGGPNGVDYGNRLALDAQGNVYVTGTLSFSNSIYFDGLHVPMSSSSAFHISFVAKYNSEGSIQWVRYVYSTLFGQTSGFAGLAIDTQGNVILGGRYSDYALRFSNNFPTVGAQPNGPHSFLTAFDSNGTRLWVNIPPYVDTGTDANLDVKLFGDQVAVLNQFSGTVPSVNGSITTYGYNDLRVQSFSLNGESLGDLQIGGTLGEHGNGLLVSDDKLLMIGWTSSHPLHVGANELEHPDLANTFVLEFTEGENGLQEQVREQMLRVFPNPAAGPINILLDGASSVSRIVLRDALGRAVLEVPAASQRLVLHPPGCGIYLVELWEGDERLAVQRVAIL